MLDIADAHTPTKTFSRCCAFEWTERLCKTETNPDKSTQYARESSYTHTLTSARFLSSVACRHFSFSHRNAFGRSYSKHTHTHHTECASMRSHNTSTKRLRSSALGSRIIRSCGGESHTWRNHSQYEIPYYNMHSYLWRIRYSFSDWLSLHTISLSHTAIAHFVPLRVVNIFPLSVTMWFNNTFFCVCRSTQSMPSI